MATGAGGTEGGIGRFLIGLAMMIGGGYLFLSSIHVTSPYGWGMGLYHFGGFAVTSGMVLIPFIFGVVLVFFDAESWIGWLLAGGSLLALAFGVIRNVRLAFADMSAFDLLVILILLFGGIGLFASSLRERQGGGIW